VPEGHTVHRAARLQRELLAGSALAVDSPQGRFAEEAALLDGQRLESIEAYGKHLFYAFESGVYLHVHLGLFGKFRMGAGRAPEPRGAVRVRFQSERGWVTLSGPTACEILDASGRRSILARIGPDPLRPTDRPARAFARIAKSSTPIGALLMDQSVIAGIGNVYRAELLFRAGIAPQVPGRAVPRTALLELWRDARALLRAGERTGRIVTFRPRERHYVYNRTGKPCRTCATPIVSATMAARTVYWCPGCQH